VGRVGGLVRRPFDDHCGQPAEAVVQRQLGGHALGVAVLGALVAVEQRVDVVAVGEHPLVAVQPVDLAAGPVGVLLGPAGQHPVERQVRPGPVVAEERTGIAADAPVLQVMGRDPALAREEPGADHAPRVEVVALVPAVVGDLVALVRLDQREQHAAQLDLAAQVGLVGGVGGLRFGRGHEVIP
jgi:hypothetical protein